MEHIRTTVGLGGLEVSYFYDEIGDRLVVRHRMDHEPVLEANKAAMADSLAGNRGYTPSREMRWAARIPEDVVMIWRQMGIDVFNDDHWPRIAAMLDSPEWAHLRTAPGKLSRRPHREFLQARRRSR